jgi:hypothetical protein
MLEMSAMCHRLMYGMCHQLMYATCLQLFDTSTEVAMKSLSLTWHKCFDIRYFLSAVIGNPRRTIYRRDAVVRHSGVFEKDEIGGIGAEVIEWIMCNSCY